MISTGRVGSQAACAADIPAVDSTAAASAIAYRLQFFIGRPPSMSGRHSQVEVFSPPTHGARRHHGYNRRRKYQAKSREKTDHFKPMGLLINCVHNRLHITML